MKKIILSILILGFLATLSGTGVWYFKKYDTYEYEHKGFFPLPVLKPLWERKVPTEQDVRIGMITDNHVHAKRIVRENKANDAPRYLNDKYITPLNEFNEEMKEFKPDFVIDLGDVEGTNDDDFVGLMGLELVEDELEKSGVPVYIAVGNHDLRSFNKTQFKETLGLKDVNQIIDYGDYRFIILDSNFYPDGSESEPGHSSIGGAISEDVFNWVEPLLQTNKHVFVFMHHPPFGNGKGIERVPFNGERLRLIFEKYNVEAVFSGHIELNYAKENNGVKYYAFRGTKKSENNNSMFQKPFYELTIEDSKPRVKMFYVDVDSEERGVIDFDNEIEALEQENVERIIQMGLDKENDENDEDYDENINES